MLSKLRDEKWLLSAFLIIVLAELTFVVNLSDLQVWLGNWESKSRELLNFKAPSSNFYGPGGAILLLPFIWNSPGFLVPVYVYFILGCLGYFLLTREISDIRFRVAALLVIPANPYLLWLCHSSQDTVLEFALLTWTVYFLLKKKWLAYAAVGYLLAETRAGYWTMFLGLGLILLARDLMKRRGLKPLRYLSIPLLVLTSTFNFYLYSSPSPALEGGITAYFSQSKYLYLSLPKMDMDVFLSGENGIFSEEYGPTIPDGASESESNSIFQDAAIKSLLDNPRENMLATMQKFESYFFGVQKVPHLPGEYVLDIKNKKIDIGDERLSWSLIIGNLAYEIYRSLLLLGGLTALGALLYLRRIDKAGYKNLKLPFELIAPWVFGIIPALLLYTETRFKVVTETLLFLFVIVAWERIYKRKSLR
jgi:hypothetical protein